MDSANLENLLLLKIFRFTVVVLQAVAMVVTVEVI